MNKIIIVITVFALSIIECYAQSKVRGELRTEINGFKWYCYKNKEAYTIDGKRLFSNLKDVHDIKYIVADKDDKAGGFSVRYKRRDKVLGIFNADGVEVAYVYDDRKELASCKRIALTFTNPKHKEYYFLSTYKTYNRKYASFLYNSNKCITDLNFTSFEVKGNYIIFRNNFLSDIYEVSRYDGKEIIKSTWEYKSIEHKIGTNLFICMINSGIKNLAHIVDTLGNTIAEGVVTETNNMINVKTDDGTGLLAYSGKWIVSPQKSLQNIRY